MIDWTKNGVPESWCCVDCGVNTAPGCPNRADLQAAYECCGDAYSVTATIDQNSEFYQVKPKVWKRAGGGDGCLCIGCLEVRLKRRLVASDFVRPHPFQEFAATPRLQNRRRHKGPAITQFNLTRRHLSVAAKISNFPLS